MATRDITVAATTAAEAAQSTLLLFVEMDFSSGFVRVTNAAYDVTWNSLAWQGVGFLGAVREVRETLGIEATALEFSISGVDPANIGIALGEHYQGRSARMWAGFIDAGAIVISPVLLFVGRMDTMQIQDGETAQITVTAESRLASWSRPKVRRFSDSDQQAEFPGDLGLQYISELASGREIPWGRS